ncbi:MAG: urea amidolyase [Cereibacter sphaeroides]|uniref:Urea amidolyase n=1 Tax=Cereibacter sphaeroides TaxID=1063 RepID=A0A2W5U1B5_CERSP|nr:MAG: urea amidolyase [Cereibacter sphaeroides]
MTGLRILRTGPGTTLQDAGRRGWLRFGVTPAGPMDWIAHATANLLAGNPAEAGCIECGPGGIELAAEDAPLRLGIAATGFDVAKDGAAFPARSALTLHSRQRLTIRPGGDCVWAYVSVAGGFRFDAVMGSLSTHLRSGIGPLGGRALQTGDLLPCDTAPDAAPLALPDQAAPRRIIRFVPGPQADAFTEQAMTTFTTTDYTITPHSDRMGYRLSGQPLAHAKGHDIVSDGIAMGAIQVPGDSLPIVLMADRQPTGGYPKIGTVIRADLPTLAQSRPGTPLRFTPATVDEAVAALRREVDALAALPRQTRPLQSGPDLTKLASGDHASGFIDARDGEDG